VLSTRSKRLLVLFIVLGVLEYVGIAVAVATTSGNRAAFDALVQAHDSLGNQINTAQTQLQACGSGTLQCNETYQGQLADAFSTFGEDVSTIHFPSAAQGDVQKLESDTAQLSSLLHQMASAPDVASYQSEFSQAQTLGNQFDADYSSLAASLLF
jgi:enoyl-[acyl-carrier-protein] reductase (NADH)